MQVSRNDITANETDVVAARKDSRPPGKGFIGSGKITALGEKFYGGGKYVAVTGEYVAAVEEYVAAAGKYVATTEK